MGQLIGGIGGGFGSILGGIGGYQSAESAKNAAKLNARLAHEEGDAAAARTFATGRRVTGINITRVAKSGVRLEGSPLEVLAANAGEAAKQASRERRFGQLVGHTEWARAKQARTAGTMSLVGGLVGGGASVAGGISQTSRSEFRFSKPEKKGGE